MRVIISNLNTLDGILFLVDCGSLLYDYIYIYIYIYIYNNNNNNNNNIRFS